MSVHDQIAKIAREAVSKRNKAIDDVILKLLMNGYATEEIQIQEYPHMNRSVIVARGVPVFEYSIKTNM